MTNKLIINRKFSKLSINFYSSRAKYFEIEISHKGVLFNASKRRTG